jgi:Spy/CpxP family protein refolding chaperone
MKKKSIINMSVFILAIIFPLFLSAQGGPALPNLTAEQKSQIEKLRTSHQKEMQQLKNEEGENRARFQTLMTADKPDMAAINKNIDEFGKIKTDMMKKDALHTQSIRALLTEEQKLVFDAKHSKDGKGKDGKKDKKPDGSGTGKGKGGHK